MVCRLRGHQSSEKSVDEVFQVLAEEGPISLMEVDVPQREWEIITYLLDSGVLFVCIKSCRYVVNGFRVMMITSPTTLAITNFCLHCPLNKNRNKSCKCILDSVLNYHSVD